MDNFSNLFENLISVSRKHEQYREKECINMSASEGLKSPAGNWPWDSGLSGGRAQRSTRPVLSQRMRRWILRRLGP